MTHSAVRTLTVKCRICGHFWIVFSLRRLVARSEPALAWLATPLSADHIIVGMV
jgi:ribosomal protein S27E